MSSSSSDADDSIQTLNRILLKTGASPLQIPNSGSISESESDSDSDSDSGIDVQDWFVRIQEKFSICCGGGGSDPITVVKPLAWKPLAWRFDGDSDSNDEDIVETMAAINRRFDQYRNSSRKEPPQQEPIQQETVESHQAVDEPCDLSEKALPYSQFPKSAQNFVDALKKNRSCQKFIRRKLIEIEAKIEENKKLKERVKCLMDFQLVCKRKVGQRTHPRVRLISMQQPRPSKSTKVVQTCTKVPALYFGPAENSHVSTYKTVMERFPYSVRKQPWSNKEKENLASGLKQQFQEMLLLNSMNMESDAEGSVNPDLMTELLSNDFEVTPEKIRSFLPLVNWDRLASMYLTGRSGPECEVRWLNYEDPLINFRPWTILEDKKLLFIVQERGLYNWVEIAIKLGTQRTPFQCLARYQRSLNPHILNKDWTKDEDARLLAAVETYGENWQLIAYNLEGRVGVQCSNRWRKSLNPGRRIVGRWSVDEDKRLKVAVVLFGSKNWNKIAQFVSGRTQVQCRERWHNCLDPSLKLEPWTEEEDARLLAAIAEHGYSWSRVATCVSPRTDNQCMRRWKILCPHEVPMLRAARQVKRTALISNFVDRERERPSIGPADFSSPVNLPNSESEDSRGIGKKNSRGSKKVIKKSVSCDKSIKKSSAKSRTTPEENLTEGDSMLYAQPSLPCESSKKTRKGASSDKAVKSKKKSSRSEENATAHEMENLSAEISTADLSTLSAQIFSTLESGTSQRTREKAPSNNHPDKSVISLVEALDESIATDAVVSTGQVAYGVISNGVNSSVAANRKIKKARKKKPKHSIHNQPGECDAEVRQSHQIMQADNILVTSEVDSAGLTFDPGARTSVIGNTKWTIQRKPSFNDIEVRCLSKSNAGARTPSEEPRTAHRNEIDQCAADAPLISWLSSLSSDAKRKLLRRSGAIHQETPSDDIENVSTEKLRAKRKSSSICSSTLLNKVKKQRCTDGGAPAES